jgi:nucleotide-binding universal stress UspA family protein
MLTIRTVLHPTDFYTHSDYAFRLACSLARDHRARLVFLHVATPPPVVTPTGIITEAKFDAYKEQLGTALRQLQAPDPKLPVEHRLAVGDPATEILQAAKDVQADLIVMGTHGRAGASRVLMGSVAEQVLRRASCPVLTVKAPVCGAHGEPVSDGTGQAS